MSRKILIICLIILLTGSSPLAFAQTASQSDTRAKVLFLEGKAAHDGLGVPQDFARAKALYLQAAELGSIEANINLGYLYFTGQGVKTDHVKARSYYEIAASKGNSDALKNLAMMDARKLGLTPVVAAKPKKDVPTPKPVEDNTTNNSVESKTDEAAIDEAVKTPAQSTPHIPLDLADAETSSADMPLAFDNTSVLDSQFSLEFSPLLTPMAENKPTINSAPYAERVSAKAAIPETQPPTATDNALKTETIHRIIAIALLILATLVMVAHSIRQRKIKRDIATKALFAECFYDAKRSELRLTYLRRRNNDFVETTFYKQWNATLTVLMARYALLYDGPDQNVRKFCRDLNTDLKSGLCPTRSLAAEFSDSLMKATMSEIKAVDAFHTANLLKEDTVVTLPAKRDDNSSTKSTKNVIALFNRKNSAIELSPLA